MTVQFRVSGVLGRSRTRDALHVCWRRSNGRINVCLCLESSKECRKPVLGDLSALQRRRHASLKYFCFVRQDVKSHRSSMRTLVSKEVLDELSIDFLVGLKRSPSSPLAPSFPEDNAVLHSAERVKPRSGMWG